MPPVDNSSRSAPRPRRILLLTTSDSIGGMQRVVMGIARQLRHRGDIVRNVFPAGDVQHELLAWAARQGVDAEVDARLTDAGEKHTLGGMLALARMIRAFRPDVVNLHYGDNFISLKDLVAARLAGHHRIVVSVYHPTPWSETGAWKRRLTRAAAICAHSVVVESEPMRQVLLEAGVPAGKIALIPLGVDPPAAVSREQARRELSLPDDAFVVGSLARLTPHKGIDDLIEAAATLADPARRLRLVVAGEGSERDAWRSLANEKLGADRVCFPGRVDSASTLYAASDVFALPSYREGFGMVYIEAAFHGVPSIAGAGSGADEAVQHDETGVLVTPGDRHAIACALATMWSDGALRARLGDAARQRAHAEFTENAMGARVDALFESLITRRATPASERLATQ